MQTYLTLVDQVLTNGVLKPNRTGTAAYTIVGAMLQHDLADGFPLLTTKKVPFHAIKVELEFFIKGKRDKRWLQENKCHIWDPWANPQKIPPNLSDEERKQAQKNEPDLGPIYGFQWRNFPPEEGVFGIDQLKGLIHQLKTDPYDRRMLVSSWNPLALPSMALPPCHVLFHLVLLDGRLNLTWFQRSCDMMVGIPFNLASYALLLHLLAKEANLEEGVVTGMLSDVHIYENHVTGAKEQLKRSPMNLPQIETHPFTSILDWSYTHTQLIDYESHPGITFEVAV